MGGGSSKEAVKAKAADEIRKKGGDPDAFANYGSKTGP